MVTIGVIGAGHVGCALAFDFASRGHRVILRALPGHNGNVPRIKEDGGKLQATRQLTGEQSVEVSVDFDADVPFEESVVFVSVPSQGHALALSALESHDVRDKTIVFITGNGVAGKAGHVLDAKAVLDTATSPYSSRLNPEGAVSVRGIKERLQIAADRYMSTADREALASIFRMPLDWANNLLEIFLSGVNGVVHVPAALLNMGWIETTGGQFYFYRDGMSESVCTIIDHCDQERLAVAAAYDCKISSALTTYNTNYGTTETRFRDFAHNADAHNRTKGAQKRFLSQDVPFWLVPCAELGQKAGVPTPFIDSLILLTSASSGTNYRATGRTLESMGLGDASKEKILAAFGQSPPASSKPIEPKKKAGSRPVSVSFYWKKVPSVFEQISHALVRY